MLGFIPGVPLTNFDDGGVRQRFIFYTHKNHNFRICLPPKIITLLAYPPKNLLVLFSQLIKISLFFFATQKITASFIDPRKKYFGPKFQTKKITRTPPPPPSLKNVSGAPGGFVNYEENYASTFELKFCKNTLIIMQQKDKWHTRLS